MNDYYRGTITFKCGREFAVVALNKEQFDELATKYADSECPICQLGNDDADDELLQMAFNGFMMKLLKGLMGGFEYDPEPASTYGRPNMHEIAARRIN